MDTKKFSRQLTFYSIYTLLRKQQEPNETSRLRIEDARTFLGKIVKGLDSMISLNGPFFIVDDLKEVTEALGGKLENVTREEVRMYIEQIRNYNEQLRALKNNPQQFYQQERYDCLLESCRRLTDFYTENHRVLVCEETPFETKD
jgi:hypothetical protein